MKKKKKRIPWNKGLKGVQKHSIETRKKISKTHKERGVGKWMNGRTLSKKTRNKIRKKLLGRKLSEGHPFIKGYWLNKKRGELSQETKDKISNSLTGFKRSAKQRKNYSPSKIGDKNPQWNNGISKEPYSQEWTKELKDKIKLRDNYTCQKCGFHTTKPRKIKGKKSKNWLTVHHIDHDKKNCKEKNLITLCGRCNTKVNFSRSYWTKYFNKIIKQRYEGSHTYI